MKMTKNTVALFGFLLLFSSCQTTKEVIGETLVESAADPKTGVKVFERPNDNTRYGLNVGGLVKGRKEAKRKKRLDVLRNY